MKLWKLMSIHTVCTVIESEMDCRSQIGFKKALDGHIKETGYM